MPLRAGKRMLQKTGSFFGGGADQTGMNEEREIRKRLSKLVTRATFTERILAKNVSILKELSETNEEIAPILDKIQQEGISPEVVDKILQGQTVSTKEAQALLENLDGLTETVGSLEASMDVSFSDIAGFFKEMITNDEISRENRRRMVSELQEISKDNKVQSELSKEQREKFDKLININAKDLNFTKKESQSLDMLLSDLSDNTTDIKISDTLGGLNKRMESLVLTEEELADAMKEKTASGETFRSAFAEGGLKETGETIGKGLLGYALKSIGFGGFEQFLPNINFSELFMMKSLMGGIPGKGMLSKAGRGIGGVASKVLGGGLLGKAVGGLGGLFGGGATTALAGGMGGLKGLSGIGRLLGGGARMLGKIFLPIQGILSLIDFFQGWTNAEEIAGVTEDNLTILDKVLSGISSVISGLTFGLLDASKIFKFIDEGMEILFDEDKGIFGGLVTIVKDVAGIWWDAAKFLWTQIGKGFKLIFGEGGLLPKTWNFLKPILSYVGENVLEAVGDVFGFIFGPEGLLVKTWDFLKPVITFAGKAFFGTLLLIGDAFKAVFGPEGLLMKTWNFIKKVIDWIPGIPGFGVGEQKKVEKDVKELVEEKKEETAKVKPESVEAKPEEMTVEAERLEKEVKEQAAAEVRAQQKALEEYKQKIIPIPTGGKEKSSVPDRTTQVDDYGIAMVNQAFMET